MNHHQNRQTKNTDKAVEALKMYEESEKEFQNHPIWKQLGCKPEDFFGAVKKHVEGLGVSKEKWEEAYSKAKEANRISSIERRKAYAPINLKSFGGIRI